MRTRKWLIFMAAFAVLLVGSAAAAPGQTDACANSVGMAKMECEAAQASKLTANMAPVVESGTGAKTVRIVTNFAFIPGGTLVENFFYDPSTVSAMRGQRVFWTNNNEYGVPHTVTIVRAADVPKTLDQAIACFNPGGVCDAALTAHFPNGQLQPRVNVGRPWFDQPGDSLWYNPGDRRGANITAPSGTTLNYICALHPWMQGKIIVQ